jgi:hypothetical protein
MSVAEAVKAPFSERSEGRYFAVMTPCRILPAARFGREDDVLTAACDLGVCRLH